MSVNLINVLQKSFTDKSYLDLSQHVGINLESTKNGLKIIIPNVLVAILGNNTLSSSKQPTWWNALDNEYPYTDDEFVLTHHISNSTFLIKGREVLAGMFRTNHDELVSSVSSVAGIQKEKAAGLIEAGVPIVVGHLKNWMRRENWKFKDLIDNLIEHKTIITAALPAGIPSTDFGKKNKPVVNFSKTIEAQIPPIEKISIKKNNGRIWFGALVVLVLILWYLMSSKTCSKNINNDEILVPDMTEVIELNQLYEKSMDGTYYAYEMIPELVFKTE